MSISLSIGMPVCASLCMFVYLLTRVCIGCPGLQRRLLFFRVLTSETERLVFFTFLLAKLVRTVYESLRRFYE